METFKWWSKLQPLNEIQVSNASSFSGVYIIHYQNRPYYAGRSNNIRRRLREHLRSNGSRKVREGLARGWNFTFTYAEAMSFEQVEAILLSKLGTYDLGNLRRETDPADRW